MSDADAVRRMAGLLPDEDITTPEHLLHHASGLDLILAPIRPLMPDAQAFLDKRLGEATGKELFAFAICVAYGLAVGYAGANIMAATLAAAAAHRPVTVRVPLQLR